MTNGAGKYFGSASIVGLAALLCQSPAAAEQQDACGTLIDGAVTCPENQSHAEGIRYDAPGDISLDFEGEQLIAPGSGHAGIIAISEVHTNGSVTIDGAGVAIRAEDAIGAVIEAEGDIVIDLASIASDAPTPGKVAGGILAATTYGSARINVGSIETSGEYARGIVVESAGRGSIEIDAGSVSTAGFASDGITVVAGGDTAIRVGAIRGEGDYIWGVNLFNGVQTDEGDAFGDTIVDVGSIDLVGSNNIGIFLQSHGNTSISIDELNIEGTDSVGVNAASYGTTMVEVGSAVFKGQSGGIFASGVYGDARVKVDSLIAESGPGVGATSSSGNAVIDAGSVHVSGVAARAIQASSTYGNAAIRVDEVSTNGLVAHAIAAEALRGNVTVRAGNVLTKGGTAFGIFAMGESNLVELAGTLRTDGDEAHGILSSTTRGDNLVLVKGGVTTAGEAAHGLWVTGRYGTARIHASGAIATGGDRAEGIRATGEDGQVLVDAQSVITRGDSADGIHARTRYVTFYYGYFPGDPVPFTGNIDIRAAKVEVTGAGAVGISAKGLGDATILAGDVAAKSGAAIETDMIGAVSLDLRGTVRSDEGSAIVATGAEVAVDITSGARVIGARDAIVINAAGARCVLPDPVDGSPNPCPNPGNDEFDFGIGGIGGPHAASSGRALFAGSARIVNRGTIEAADGFAIRTEAGAVSIENHGQISGALLFAGGDDLLDNRGVFLAVGDSDFGGGTDILRNSGTLRVAAGRARIAGLDRFENIGAIDLRSGAAGNVLTLSGDYIGNPGATLLLDVDAANGVSDRLVIEGSASGSTRISLAAAPGDAKLTGPAGIALITVGGTSEDGAFVLSETTRDIGLVRYALIHDATRGNYSLVGRAGAGAYRQLGALQASDDISAASADIWRGRGIALRDGLRGGDENAGRRLWGTMQAGRASRDWTAANGEDGVNLDYRQSRQGGQLGFDLMALGGENAALHAGLTGGYFTAKLRYDGGERIALSTTNFGIYANYTGAKLFANLLVKYDRHAIKLDADAFAARESLDGSTWGADAEVGLSFGSPGLFVEPVVGLAWTRTRIDTLSTGSQQLAFENSELLKARAGARFGGSSSSDGGGSLTVYASANAVRLFGDDFALTVTSGLDQRIEAARLGTYGEGRLGLAYRTAGGFEIFAEGQGEIGGGYDGLTGRAGFRVGF